MLTAGDVYRLAMNEQISFRLLPGLTPRDNRPRGRCA